jgi:hypothetical protein
VRNEEGINRNEAACKEVAARDYENAKQATDRVHTPLRGGIADGCAARQSGKNALLSKVRMLRSQADRIEALAYAIPDNFPLDADAGLWEIASRV